MLSSFIVELVYTVRRWKNGRFLIALQKIHDFSFHALSLQDQDQSCQILIFKFLLSADDADDDLADVDCFVFFSAIHYPTEEYLLATGYSIACFNGRKMFW